MTKPYTYCITHKPSGKRYYGVRTQDGCEPNELWNKYFTSSKVVAQLIKEDGLSAFEVEVRKTFESKKQARSWETRVLVRLKAAQSERWLNRSNGLAPDCTNRKVSEKTKAKLRSSWTEERRQKHIKGQTGKLNPFHGKTHSPEAVERIRKGNTGKQQSIHSREKMSKSRKELIKNNPEYAEQIIKQINTPEAMEKRVKKLRGQKRTPEQKERMRQARLRYLAKQGESSCSGTLNTTMI